MGRPIQKQKYLGANALHRINATVWGTNDTGPTAGYLTRQNSDDRFRATTVNGSSLTTFVNGAPAASGQSSVKFFPGNSEGNVTLEAEATAYLKIASVSIVNGGAAYTANSVLQIIPEGGTYGNAATITVNSVFVGNGAIQTFTLNNIANQRVTELPTSLIAEGTTLTGNGAGALFSTGFGVESITVTQAGLGYGANVKVTTSGGAPDAVLTPTVAGTAITAITVTSSGNNYTVFPEVSIEDLSGTTEYVKHLASYRVITQTNEVYRWLPNGADVPEDYTNIKFGFLDTL